ncbi:heme/copper-type cytochrome/quinol oxidase subunit 4 [Staphylococcus hominis]
MVKALMLIITIVCMAYIVYNFIKDKPVTNIFFVGVIQSFLLFLIRFFWINHSFSKSFLSSFDLFMIIVVVIYLIYKLSKRRKRGINSY